MFYKADLQQSPELSHTIKTNRKRKAIYQRTCLDNVRQRANEEIHLNDHGELLSLDKIHAPSADQLANAERDPITAIMSMAKNSGLGNVYNL